MKKHILSLLAGFAAISAVSQVPAGSSPYEGNVLEPGTYYLYNVETGLWLQNNSRRTDQFTTRAELDISGIDIEITPEGEGYRLNPRFGGNHSINYSNLYMDTNEEVTEWKILPAEDAGVANAYTIESPKGKLGMGDNGFITENASEKYIWQLVTREERIAYMDKAALNNPMDVTWIVPGADFAYNDERYRNWNARFDGGNNPVSGDGKVRCNRAHESWNSNSFDLRQTITGIPNGTYVVSIQGYYRDGGDPQGKFANGTEVLRAYYFANGESKPLMSTFGGGVDEKDDLHDLGAAGKWAPNSLDNASAVFFYGEYKNEPLVVEVTDGTLTLGVTKTSNEGQSADWSVWDNWKVEYLGSGGYMSPYTGTEVTQGEFYLYNVESEMWLQNNDRRVEHFTTRAELDKRGLDIEITPEGEGYRLNPRFGGNHSINGGNLYMDTGEAVTSWNFTPVEESKASNAYTISSPNGKLGMGPDGYLSENAQENTTWQVVTREERMATLANATEDNPVDVTWLVGCPNFGWTDERYSAWNARFEGGGNSIGGHDKIHCNAVHESWNSNMIDMQQTLTGLPNGTYRVSVQGYYRDGDDPQGKFADGTEVLRTRYFANQVSKPLMSSFGGGADAQDDIHDLGAGGKWAPNSMNNASAAFFNGEYKNDPILVAVTDGELRIGLSKPSADGVSADWSVWDNWKVEYLGSAINMDNILADLREALEGAAEVAGKGTQTLNSRLDAAVEEGKALLESQDLAAVIDATVKINEQTAAIRQVVVPVDVLTRTLALAIEERVELSYPDAVSAAQTALSEAETATDVNRAAEGLRIARKVLAADTQEPDYFGTAVTRGEYYLYNVGQKRFLCGGSDWGVHAALGFPGIPVKVEGNRSIFRLRTGLFNGSGDNLGYNGYCDTSASDSWSFKEVSGKERVYNIVRTGDKSVGLGFNPYSRTDAGDDVYFYDTVGTDEPVADNENAEWMLVTKADRDNLLENASEENPVDASYLIRMPGFSQREEGNNAWNGETGAWTFNTGSIDGRGSRRDDFVFSVAGATQAFEITQTLTGLPKGKYIVSVQGFYRYGSREALAELVADGNEPERLAILYANAGETTLAGIMEGADKAPGYGWETGVGEIPDGPVSAANYFQHGLYRNSVEVNVGADGILSIGVLKENVVKDDWLAIDNFRLTYLGEGGQDGVDSVSADRWEDSPIYTLSGIEVKAPLQPGIYIRAGRKIIIR